VKRLSFRTLLYWLAPTAGVGTLAGQVRAPAVAGPVVDTLGIRSRHLATTPMVRVFLPPGYGQSGERYPVLYANDGQDVEGMGLSRTMDSLVASGQMHPIIVVAVHAEEDRLQNYGTAGQPNAQGLGSRAGAYEKFIVRELVPLVERRYRTQRGRAAIMGWSLGGLSAFDIAWRNGRTFQNVGVFSGSFWWRTDDSSTEAKQSSRIMHRRVRGSRRPPGLRAWFEVGRQDEKDDRDMNGVIDAIQDTRELIDALRQKGLHEGTDIQYLEIDGGHNVETWSTVLPQFLVWAFGKDRPRDF
jgi:enterochelin esterase-like enzyme